MAGRFEIQPLIQRQRNPRLSEIVAEGNTALPDVYWGNLMICPFCKLNVANPCHSQREVQERANTSLERCVRALKETSGQQSNVIKA
jgi:hypothetical protein